MCWCQQKAEGCASVVRDRNEALLEPKAGLRSAKAPPLVVRATFASEILGQSLGLAACRQYPARKPTLARSHLHAMHC